MQFTLLDTPVTKPQPLPSGKTSPACSTPKTTPLAVFWGRWLGPAVSCSLQGHAGQNLVVCMDTNAPSRGGFLMPNISAWHNDASASFLSQVLVPTSIPRKYYLSTTACAGILRRAATRGKTLPALLQQALSSVMHSTVSN